MRATTSGSKSEFRGKWPSGIAPTETSCGSVFDYSVDIILDWMTDSEWTAAGHGDFGGHVHSYVADEQYCDYYQFTKYDPDGPPPNGGPKGNIACGLHGSRMHVKTSRYLGYSSDTTRRNFLIHELGHSYGFIDYCGDDNRVTNNTGAAGCSLPAGWGSVDRQEMRDHIYPSGSY
jgi:hypothetical protein